MELTGVFSLREDVVLSLLRENSFQPSPLTAGAPQDNSGSHATVRTGRSGRFLSVPMVLLQWSRKLEDLDMIQRLGTSAVGREKIGQTGGRTRDSLNLVSGGTIYSNKCHIWGQ